MKQVLHPKINPYEQNRKHVRLQFFNYARSGCFYVTICTYQRFCLLGEVINSEVLYTPQGYIADVLLHEIPKHHQQVKVVSYVIMPDHIHLMLTNSNEKVDQEEYEKMGQEEAPTALEQRKNGMGKQSLSSIIASYKAAVTRHCHRLGLKMKWQDSFYDRVVANAEEKESFKRYIINNPVSWDEEKKIVEAEWPADVDKNQ